MLVNLLKFNMKTLNEASLNVLLNLDNEFVVSLLKERLPRNIGSVFDWASDLNILCSKLKQAKWVKDVKLDLLPGTVGYRAEIPGLIGVVKISDLEKNFVITLDDKNSTGKFTPIVVGVNRPVVNHTVMVIGSSFESDTELSKDEKISDPIINNVNLFEETAIRLNKKMLWAIHPGDPVKQSTLPIDSMLSHGSQITAGQALKLGMVWAKIE